MARKRPRQDPETPRVRGQLRKTIPPRAFDLVRVRTRAETLLAALRSAEGSLRREGAVRAMGLCLSDVRASARLVAAELVTSIPFALRDEDAQRAVDVSAQVLADIERLERGEIRPGDLPERTPEELALERRPLEESWMPVVGPVSVGVAAEELLAVAGDVLVVCASASEDPERLGKLATRAEHAVGLLSSAADRGAPGPAASSPAAPRVRALEPFIADDVQKAILDALDGRARRTDALAEIACKGHHGTLSKKLEELRSRGLVANHRKIGYYRPDRPPTEYADALGDPQVLAPTSHQPRTK